MLSRAAFSKLYQFVRQIIWNVDQLQTAVKIVDVWKRVHWKRIHAYGVKGRGLGVGIGE